jgi:hypothetical protein|tara:strand:- start:918 stop:1166 length:249 start_codon:yes stop_codon:yes gene_type:complete
MHAGNITKDTAARRVYLALCAHRGEWLMNMDLAHLAQVNLSLSTVVSQVRSQIPDDMELHCEQRGKRWYYRLAYKAEQMGLL